MVAKTLIPNFFIVGAPKCGTTAVSEYLRNHPSIFMSFPKEPHHFSDDFAQFREYRRLDDYMKLFRGRTQDHLIVGEASVWYLYSSSAVKSIYEFNKDAKILVMLRNPIDFVCSLHSQLLFAFNEDRPDFAEAWNLQEDRAKGINLPKTCIAPQFLQYRAVAKFGAQLEHFLS